MQFENEDVFSPCDDFPDNFLDKFITLPDNLTLLPDGRTYLKGDVVVIYDLQPLMKYPVIRILYKKKKRIFILNVELCSPCILLLVYPIRV